MSQKRTFQELSDYVKELVLPQIQDIRGNIQLIGYQRDALAKSLLPTDCQDTIDANTAFPVYTSGDGNCFLYALSRLVYGDELHGIEMRVRVVCEGVKNIDLYLNHDYLIRGYEFPYGLQTSLPQVYCTYSANLDTHGQLTDENIRDCYKREIMNVRLNYQECGIWQFHQAANVLGMPIFSMHPDIPLANLRADLNRMILPATEGIVMQNPLVIMWTKYKGESLRFGHFVPVVQQNSTFRVNDMNATGALLTRKVDPISIDLTNDAHSHASVSVCKQQANKKDTLRSTTDSTDDNISTKAHENTGNKERSCTCCHSRYTDARFLRLFNVDNYNFDHDIVQDALNSAIRYTSDDGMEYICKTCHTNLRKHRSKKPTMPRKAAANKLNKCGDVQQCTCTCCHHIYSKGTYMRYFNEGDYNFENSVVADALHTDARAKSSDNKEYICRSCRNYLVSTQPVMPHKAYVTRTKQKNDNDTVTWKAQIAKAGKKFLDACKELPEYVCTSCHRMLFKKSVMVFNEKRYNMESALVMETLSQEYRYKRDGKEEYICNTCNSKLRIGCMPSQAVANQLSLPEIPPQVAHLTRLELRCITLRIPFMNIRPMPKGGQGKITGPCVNVPTTLEPIADVLPRIPEDAHLILVKLKRKLIYKSSYLCDYIRPDIVLSALHWLKRNNSHYEHVTIDETWLDRISTNTMFVEESSSKKSTDLAETSQESTKPHEQHTVISGNDDDSAMLEHDQAEVNRRAEITVEPTSSCIQIDDLENTAFSIAPGENAIPQYILTDKNFEVCSFVDCFPGGFGGFDVVQARKAKLDLRRYVNQRLLNVDSRCARNFEYIFAFQYATELKQLQTDMRMALRKIQNGHNINAGKLRNPDKVRQLVYDEVAYKFMKNTRGTPAYWQSKLYDVLAMLRRLGTPTWFLTLSPAEFKWPEFIQACSITSGEQLSTEDINSMSWTTKSSTLSSNPVPVCRMWENRLNSFFTDFLLTDAAPLGKITDHCEKIEFQVRGSPHCHALLWVQDAPKIDNGATDEEVCSFVDKYINGKIPLQNIDGEDEEENMHTLVTQLQTHSHSSSCRKHVNAKCRFHFPRPPSTKTIISRQLDTAEGAETEKDENRQIIAAVTDAMEEHLDWDLREILESINISEERYLQCLQVSSKNGTSVILERDTADVRTNNHNRDCLRYWRGNMDLQYVSDAFSCIMYVLSYVMKPERGMSELLKQAEIDSAGEGYHTQMKKVASTFVNKREVSIQESVMRVNSQWMFRKSRTIIFIHNGQKDMRYRMPLPKDLLDKLDDDDEDIFCHNIHERYAARPDNMETVCLATFAAWWVNIPASDKKNWKNIITLKDDMGLMRKRLKEAFMRCHSFKEGSEDYVYSQLLLFMPWRIEEEDLLSGFPSYRDHYNHVREEVEKNAKVHNMHKIEIDTAWAEFWNNPPDVDLMQARPNDNEAPQEDCFNTEPAYKKDYTSPLSLKYKAEALKDTISNQEYRQMMRGLNDEQRSIVMFNRMSIKKSIWQKKEGIRTEPYLVFLSGPGGTGKSHVIKLIYRDNVVLHRKSNTLESSKSYLCTKNVDEMVIALLTSYTGTASFNINGATLSSIFQLHQQKISHKTLSTMKTRLETLQHLTIDEVSMVGAHHLAMINERCALVKNEDPSDCNFGNICVLLVGDLYQLPPVCALLVFEMIKNAQRLAHLVPSIWQEFVMHELTQVMRQKDPEFAAMLNEVRVKTPVEGTKLDDQLKQRELTLHEDHPDYPNKALHVYAQNVHADARNEKMLDSIDKQLYICKAHDSVVDNKISLDKIILPQKPSDTANLRHTVLVKESARVMLTSNICVADGLTNGAFGEVTAIICTQRKDANGHTFQTAEVHAILVRFDSDRVGVAAKARSPYKDIDAQAVPIYRIEGTFELKNRKNVSINRKNFPLNLAWAVTIHKTQGMTVNEIVVDMTWEKGRYQHGQAYVAFSRVRTYEKLHIINYTRKQIHACPKVTEEMQRLRQKKLPPLPQPLVRSIDHSYLRIGHINMQGIGHGEYCKRSDLKSDTDIQNLDVVCLTETHLPPAQGLPASEVWAFKRGTAHMYNRRGAKGGGVAVIVSDTYNSARIDIGLQLSPVEVVAVEVSSTEKVAIVACYIPPGLANGVRITQVQYILQKISQLHYNRVVLLGDFNENLLTCEQDHHVRDYIVSQGFLQHIGTPTTDYGSLLDHVYTQGLADVKTDVQDAYYSDHDKTFCFVK